MIMHPRPRYSLATRFVLGATLVSLAGCGGAGDELARNIGLTRDAPDEFVVTTRAPLSMPPDLSLPPPSPGAARPQERTSRDAAQLALAPQGVASNTTNAPRSQGEAALLGATSTKADPGIRSDVDRLATQDARERSFTDRIMFWKEKPPGAVIVDANRESQRLQENQALGRAPVAGNTPVAKQDSGLNWLERRFSSDKPATTQPPAPSETKSSFWDMF